MDVTGRGVRFGAEQELLAAGDMERLTVFSGTVTPCP